MIFNNKKIKKELRIIFIFFIILVLFTPLICAQNYYADIQISVDKSGFVDIKGVSNYPNLIVENSQSYTYKKQSYWLLNITIQEVFSDYVFVLSLPYNSKINSINTSGFSSIEEIDGRLTISGAGQNETLFIIIYYQISSIIEEQDSNYYSILTFLFSAIIVLTVLLIFFIYRDKFKKSIISETKNYEKVDYNLKGLSLRQKEIIKLLIKLNRPVTQGEIQKELNYPKAAVSRNIHSLEIKGLIEIEKIGMSNLIRLKKQQN